MTKVFTQLKGLTAKISLYIAMERRSKRVMTANSTQLNSTSNYERR